MSVARHALGLMSGTSMDGVDAVLCEFEGNQLQRVMATHHLPYPASLRQRLLTLQRKPDPIQLSEWAELDNAVAHCFSNAALPLVGQHSVDVIGSHGQTVFHDPIQVRSSLQLGNPSLIAAKTGVCTVADFRRADIALGGQGAPLVPAFHHAQFARVGQNIAVINIGGISNITLLPGADSDAVRGWDTGPGNGLMDEWIHRHHQQDYDAGGRWGSTGVVDVEMLNSLLADPYFAAAAPKSTGRDYFNMEWLQARHSKLLDVTPVNVQRTLCELTALTISRDITQSALPITTVLLCGGGARNVALVQRLRELLGRRVTVQTTSVHGLGEMEVEGAAFAWLAIRRLMGLSGSLPSVTGASRAGILGGIYA